MIVAIGIVPLTALFILVVIAVLGIRCNPLHLTGRGGGVQYSFIVVLGFIGLFGCSINPQQLKPQREGDAYPEGRGIVCAVRAGDRQNYWNERAAQHNGAVVLFEGECPAEPNSEGFNG